MHPLVTSALISGVGSLFSNAYNVGSQIKANQQNFENQKKLMAIEQDYAKYWFDKQNQYNSPMATMDRLKAAGLNPNLIYGSGAATLPSASGTVPKGTLPPNVAPQIDTSTIGDAINQLYDLKIKDSQNKAIQTNTRLQTLKAVTESIEQAGKLLDNASKKQEYDYRNSIIPTSKALLEKNLEKLMQDISIDAGDFDLRKDANKRGWYDSKTGRMNAESTRMNAETSRDQYKLAKLQFHVYAPYEIAGLMTQQMKMRGEILTLQQQKKLNDILINMQKRGVTWSDPINKRQLVNQFGDKGYLIYEEGKDLFKFLTDKAVSIFKK